MTNLSTELIKPSDTTETLASTHNDLQHHDLCLFSESPHYVVRVSLTYSFLPILTLFHRSPRSLAQAMSKSSTGLFAMILPSSKWPTLLDSVLPTTLLLAIKWRFSHSSPNTTEVIAVIDSPLSSEVAPSATDLNIEDKDGWTPLHHAARNNAVNAIEFLLENGVEDARPNKQKEAPVHIAVVHNQLRALEVRNVLDQHPPLADQTTSSKPFSALMSYCRVCLAKK